MEVPGMKDGIAKCFPFSTTSIAMPCLFLKEHDFV